MNHLEQRFLWTDLFSEGIFPRVNLLSQCSYSFWYILQVALLNHIYTTGAWKCLFLDLGISI